MIPVLNEGDLVTIKYSDNNDDYSNDNNNNINYKKGSSTSPFSFDGTSLYYDGVVNLFPFRNNLLERYDCA
jgi:hypothetical protein